MKPYTSNPQAINEALKELHYDSKISVLSISSIKPYKIFPIVCENMLDCEFSELEKIRNRYCLENPERCLKYDSFGGSE
ncbi:MAG: hypothetical protein ABFQ65_03725 [Nanoarchaeota archaeon]